MFPNLGGMDPRKLNSMMKQLGITNTEIPAKKVIIETENKQIIITNPTVTEIKMSGQTSYQIAGEVLETTTEIPKDDIKLVMENTKVDEKTAEELLKKSNGNIAEAIAKATNEE